MALTLYGIYGLAPFSYDEALNISRSLNIALVGKSGGYRLEDQHIIGINQEVGGRRGRATSGDDGASGYAAPLVRKGSKLRLAKPEERDPRRLEHPQTDWDVLHGLIMAYRKGDIPVARPYLENQAENPTRILDLLEVWAKEMDDEAARREAESIHYGLKQRH